MKRHMLSGLKEDGASDEEDQSAEQISSRSNDDLERLLKLKGQVRQIAQVVSASHSFTSYSEDKEKEMAQKHFKEIFDRLLMCHGELDYAIQSMKNTIAHTQEPFDKFFSVLFENKNEKSVTADAPEVVTAYDSNSSPMLTSPMLPIRAPDMS